MWYMYPKQWTQEWRELMEKDRATLECFQVHEDAPLVIEAPYPVLHSSGKRFVRLNYGIKYHQSRMHPVVGAD